MEREQEAMAVKPSHWVERIFEMLGVSIFESKVGVKNRVHLRFKHERISA